MPLPNTFVTGGMITATALAAAGLNLGVMSIGTEANSSQAATVGAQAQAAESVELLGLQPPAAEGSVDQADNAPAEQGEVGEAGQSGVSDQASTTESAVGQGSDDASELGDGGQTHTDDTDGDDEGDAYGDGQGDGDDQVEAPDDTDDAEHRATPVTPPAPTGTGSQPTIAVPPATGGDERRPAPTPAPAPTSATVTEYLTYEFKGVASIVIAVHDEKRLEFWSAKPVSGWGFRVDDDDGSLVKIKFRPLDGGDEAEWELRARDGRFDLKQEY